MSEVVTSRRGWVFAWCTILLKPAERNHAYCRFSISMAKLPRWRAIALAIVLANLVLVGCKARSDSAADASNSAGDPFLLPASGRSKPKNDLDIDWLDLMPDAERKALEAGEWPKFEIAHDNLNSSGQFGSKATVATMDGRKVRIPGYVVPLEFDDQQRMRSFFLVPYYGACLHVPPPPPNQLIYAQLAEPLEVPSMWDAYWLTGTVRIMRVDNDVASSSYSIEAPRLDPWTR